MPRVAAVSREQGVSKMPRKIPIRKVGPHLPREEPITKWPKPPVTYPGVIRPRRTDGEPDDAKHRAR